MSDMRSNETWKNSLPSPFSLSDPNRGDTLPIRPLSPPIADSKSRSTLQPSKERTTVSEHQSNLPISSRELALGGMSGPTVNTDLRGEPLLQNDAKSSTDAVSGDASIKAKELLSPTKSATTSGNSLTSSPAVLPLSTATLPHNPSPKINALVGTLRHGAGKVSGNIAQVFNAARGDKYKPQLDEDSDEDGEIHNYYNPLADIDSDNSFHGGSIDGGKTHLPNSSTSDSNYVELQRYNYSRKDSMNVKGDLSSQFTPNHTSFPPVSSMYKQQQPPPQLSSQLEHFHRAPPVSSSLRRSSTGSGGRTRHYSCASSTSSIRSVVQGCVISFHNISYVVKSKRFPWSKVEKRTVLNDVSGIMRPGLNAIMGTTGSGKSSLLDVLAGRKDPAYLQGTLLIDGFPQPPNFKCLIGYVVQDDIVMGTLTVKENLRFSAALRLSKEKFSNADRERKVEEILEELGLVHVANSKIGTELIRGVSGGERKRTNIGIELITDPRVLFLDEPTTGLDAFTANSVIKTLKNLSRRGRTIIFSIHQPKYSIYKLFDTLTLVSKGELVYHGPAENHPLQYFRTLNYVCEAHNNPPDFFLDILHGEVEEFHNETIPEEDSCFEDDGSNFEVKIDLTDTKENISDRLIKHWRESNQCTQIMTEVNRIYQQSQLLNGSEENLQTRRPLTVSYHTSFLNQMWYVSWRTALNLIRNPQASIVQLAVYLFFAISMGVVYLRIDKSTEAGIQNRSGFFFFTSLQMVFVNLSAIEVFIKERQIFIHETSSGFYRTSAYFLAKVFCDMLPIKALPVVIFMPITYWMVGLKADGGAFLFFELVLLLTTVAACGVAFFVSATVSIFGIANILISITYVFMMVFGGYLINLLSMGKWLSWCQYFSIFRYSISALSINEFTDVVFCPVTNISLACKSGEVYLAEQDIPFSSGWNRWSNVLGLFVISVFFCTLCYVQLRRINRYK